MKKSLSASPYNYILLLSLFGVFILFSCNENKINEKEISGEELSQQYCVGCHLYPEPKLLAKESWKKIMPEMAKFMGIYYSEGERDSLISGSDFAKSRFLERNVFPEYPMLDKDAYEKITQFYYDNAPEKIISSEDYYPVDTNLTTFKPLEPSFKVKVPSTTMAYISGNQIFIGDANTKSLSIFDKDGNLIRTGNVNEGAVWLNRFSNVDFVTVMGSFTPTDEPKGMLVALPNEASQGAVVLIDSLQRPVHTSVEDLNGDGLPDFIISEFGHLTGQLSVHLNEGANSFKRINLREKPGALKSIIKDINGDGHKDIIALFAQADEGIWKYINDGKGNFTEENVMRFPSIYGSAFISMQDLNGDGFDDIIYCNGDNADFSVVLKPFHGIRLLMNDTKGNWKEEMFLPLNGAYKAIADDFDLDGDMDIAAVSFFPDFYNNLNESFVLFENSGEMNFIRKSFPNTGRGRWLVMDAGDIDSDGDLDLVLGSLMMQVDSTGSFVNKWMEKGLPYLFLENTTN